MEDNPALVPSSAGITPSRPAGAILSAVCGVPLAGILSYLLFGWCAAIGSRVVSDDEWFDYSPGMFMYGAIVAVVPSLICGLLHHCRPFVASLSSHVIGVASGAVVAYAGCRWQFVMATYFIVVLVLPILLFVACRWNSLGASLGSGR